MYCDLDINDRTLGQGHYTLLDQVQQLCKILSDPTLVSSEELWPWTQILGICAVTLTLDICPWVKVMTHPWVMDNYLCEILSRSDKWVRSYSPDVMRTDGQTDGQAVF